ncbi:hypothetical protein EG329_012189 [Mollisiaceae sp. DMI_Dod_QoI]|nr:hypothetical protein EG329_012189 [Helotiales sp. DMI_Dod_QoI]
MRLLLGLLGLVGFVALVQALPDDALKQIFWNKTVAGDFGAWANYQTAVVFANHSMWIGGMKYQSYSEPLIVKLIIGGHLKFTSWHETPLGFSYPYIFDTKTAPVGFKDPRSSSIPAGATPYHIRFNKEGILTYNGKNKFVGCRNEEMAKLHTFQIWWQGAGPLEGWNCSTPLIFYAGSPSASDYY